MRFFSSLYRLKKVVSKNVQNYKKSPICQKVKTLKNFNFIPSFHPQKRDIRSASFSMVQNKFFSPNAGLKVQIWTKNELVDMISA
jgi:hypothetical protein